MINEFCSLGDVKTIAIMKSPKIAQFEAKKNLMQMNGR